MESKGGGEWKAEMEEKKRISIRREDGETERRKKRKKLGSNLMQKETPEVAAYVSTGGRAPLCFTSYRYSSGNSASLYFLHLQSRN